MKYLLTRKDNNKVVAISDGKIGFDKDVFILKKKTITKAVQKELNDGNDIICKDKIEVIKNNNQRIDIKNKIDNAKDVSELKKILLELL